MKWTFFLKDTEQRKSKQHIRKRFNIRIQSDSVPSHYP